MGRSKIRGTTQITPLKGVTLKSLTQIKRHRLFPCKARGSATRSRNLEIFTDHFLSLLSVLLDNPVIAFKYQIYYNYISPKSQAFQKIN